MKTLLVPVALCLLAGCAAQRPGPSEGDRLATPPPGWTTPVPHGGDPAQLAAWWQQRGDPLTAELVAAAQAASPTVAQAAARIAQARASRTAAGAALLPTLDGTAQVQRGPLTGSTGPGGTPIATTAQAGLQAQWELDLFGANAAARDAAEANYAAARSQWHDARVAVAAETATSVLRHRACVLQLAVTRQDATSRGETARLTDLAAGAGFQAPATAALARASASEGAVRVLQQAARCDTEVQSLAVLTALPAAELIPKLAVASMDTAPPAPVFVASVPAAVLAQRPDVRAAELAVAAAAAEAASVDAQRYPRLSLSGSVAAGRVRTGGIDTNAETWTVGPLALSVPLFDGGRRAANAEAARARYDEAAALYRGRVRQAVGEVEQALIALDSVQRSVPDVVRAADGYRASFEATEARYRGGLASLVELEDARRLKLAADTTLVDALRERAAASVSLYRAVGGGWTPADDTAAPDGRRPAHTPAPDATSPRAIP